MHAAYFTEPGPPSVLQYGELPTPDPQPGQVRVKVLAASVNPIDMYMRSGAIATPAGVPKVPGCDFAGVVDAVGANVTRVQPGDRVWGSNQGLLGRPGTFAEYCCPDQEWVYPLPDGVGDAAAAAVALVGITAHLGLFGRARLRAGETVFVNGGTGGVGACVVQMAKAAGAKVITTVGNPEKVRLAGQIGADVVINYTTGDVADAVRQATGGKGVDVWFETIPPTDLDRTVELTAPRGRIVLMAGRQARPVLPNGPFYVKNLSVFGFAMFNATAAEQQVAADDINTLLAANTLRPIIGAQFLMSAAAAAHQLQEDNTTRKAGTLAGKIVVTPG